MPSSQSLSSPFIRFITAAISLALVLAGLVFAAQPADAAAAKWTVMVYISGDNNLEDYVVKDLELELGVAGSNADVQIVALADRGPGYDTSRGDWQTHQALPRDAGHDGRRRQARLPTGASETWATSRR